MVSPKDVQGRIYSFKSKTELLNLGIILPDIPEIVRRHMVLVLRSVHSKKGYVEVMTITSKLKDTGEYVPISPTPKKGFPIQLQLANHYTWFRGQTVINLTRLPQYSYLKIDLSYQIPIQVLEEVVDNLGEQMMIYARRRGGLGELRNHIQGRDHVRKVEELRRAMENQTLVENGE